MFIMKKIILLLALACTGLISASEITKPEDSTNNLLDGDNLEDAIKAAIYALDSDTPAAYKARSVVEDSIRKAIEKFRTQMGSSNEELGIPTLDPLEIPQNDFHLVHEVGKVNGTVGKTIVTEASKFNIDHLQYKRPFGFDFIFTFPSMKFDGSSYDITGEIGDLFQIFGKGPFQLDMIGLTVGMNSTLTLGMDLKFKMKAFSLDIKLASMKANFQNLMGGGELEETFNKLISEMASEAVDIFWPEMKAYVTEGAKKVADDILKKIDILAIINPKP